MRVFTVHMPGGTKDLDYEAYVRLLNAWGIDVTDMPRVLEEGPPNRWLYAWEDRDEAERFARDLRSRTRNKRWQVQELTADRLPHGPLGPVEIYVNCQSSGCTYGLHPNSEALVRKKFPNARLVPSVFIGNGTRNGFEQDGQEPIWEHVAMILTGLNGDQLKQLGGYRVYDPANSRVFREPEPSHAPTLGRR